MQWSMSRPFIVAYYRTSYWFSFQLSETFGRRGKTEWWLRRVFSQRVSLWIHHLIESVSQSGRTIQSKDEKFLRINAQFGNIVHENFMNIFPRDGITNCVFPCPTSAAECCKTLSLTATVAYLLSIILFYMYQPANSSFGEECKQEMFMYRNNFLSKSRHSTW